MICFVISLKCFIISCHIFLILSRKFSKKILPTKDCGTIFNTSSMFKYENNKYPKYLQLQVHIIQIRLFIINK